MQKKVGKMVMFFLWIQSMQKSVTFTLSNLLCSWKNLSWSGITDINNVIKEPTEEYQNWNTTKMLVYGGYVKVRESLYTRVIFWVNTILNHINTRAVLPDMKVFAW